MAPGWRLRRGIEREEEGASRNGQRGSAAADAADADAAETTATRTETGNPDAPLSNSHNNHDDDDHDDHDGDDGAPESLDFQTIYNAAFELRRSSLDPGRRAAFESVESLDFSAAAVAAAAEGAGAEAGASASADGGEGGNGSSPAAALVVVGSGGDTSAELKLRGKPFLGIKPHTLFKLAATAAIGLGTGCLAASLGAAVDRGLRFKNAAVHAIVRSHDFSPAGVALAALFAASWAALLTSLSAFLVATLAPVSAGSGVSLVMAYLNGNAVPRLLEAKTLAVKWVGTGLSVASGVTLGLEAPLVHLGACVASLCADAAGRAWELSYRASERVAEWRSGRSRGGGGGEGGGEHERPLLSGENKRLRGGSQRRRFIPILQSDAERREFVSAGVAAGLAAAFGAPIGGVLFAMEEASTHWSRKVGWRAFLAATATAVALNQLYPRAFGVLRFAGVAPLSALEWAHQLPLLALVAAVGGLLGAGFQALHRAAARRARRGRERSGRGRATKAAFVLRAAVTSAVIVMSMFALSLAAGTCVEVPEWRDKGYGFVLTCPPETYNDLATLFFAPAADTASHIFSSGALTPRFNVCSRRGASGPGTEEDDSCYFTLRSLALLCPAYFASMAASSATGLPGGLFLPSIVAGGSFGGTAGLLLSRALPAMRLQAGLFAMVGATAALGGVFRASVALVVLVVEGTQSVRFLLAIAVAAIAANWAGDLCRPGGVYESDLEADGRVVFLRPTPPPALHFRTAGSVAARGVWAFREVESVAYVLDVLARTRHNGFPVVRASARERQEEKERRRREKEALSLASAAAGKEEERGGGGGVNKGGGDGGDGDGGDGDGDSSFLSSSPEGSVAPSAPSAMSAAAAEEEEPEAAPTTTAAAAASGSPPAPISSATSREGVLVGLILRSQLLVLLRARFFCDEARRPIPRAAADAAVASAAAAAAAEAAAPSPSSSSAAAAPAAAAAAAAATSQEDHDHDHHHHHHDVFALDSAMRSFFRLSGAPTRRAASLAPALSAAVSRRHRRPGATTATATTRDSRSPSSSSSPPPSASASSAALPSLNNPSSSSLADCFVDLRPFMDRAPLSVRPECPAERAHAAFVSLGLRHLPLTSAEGLVCGMLTRKDLDAAAGAGPWRRSKIAPAPAPPPPGGLHVPSEFVVGPASSRARARSSGAGGVGGAGVGGGIGRRARDFAAAAAAAGSAVWHGGNNNSSSASLRSLQGGGGGGGGGDERV